MYLYIASIIPPSRYALEFEEEKAGLIVSQINTSVNFMMYWLHILYVKEEKFKAPDHHRNIS